MEEKMIKDFSGRVLGKIQIQSNGDKVVKDFYGKVLGYYRKSQDATTDFYGRVICYGDASAALIPIKGMPIR